MQEAMPFDRISVRLFLDGVLQNGVDLRAEFSLTNGNDPGKRLAVARVALAWVPRQRGSRLQAQPIPVAISDDLSARFRRRAESLTLF
jgi:hypothetical protein